MKLLILSISWIVGIYLASFFRYSPVNLLIFSIPPLVGALLWQRKKWVHLGMLLLFTFCLSAARYQTALPVINEHHVAYYRDDGAQHTIIGWVAHKPEIKEQRQRVVVQPITLANEDMTVGKPLHGHLQFSTSKYIRIAYGDVLLLTGELVSPPVFDTFDYRDYLEKRSIYALMQQPKIRRAEQTRGWIPLRWLYALNDHIERTINRMLPEPESSLLAGLLLGIKRGFSDELTAAFSLTGTTHIIALSGYNIAIVVAALQAMIGQGLSPQKRFWLLLVGIGLFVIFVGAQASIVRAGIMAGFVLLGQTLGRRRDVTTSFVFTAAVMLLLNPMTLWDVGFQLSFLATAGILYVHPKLVMLPWILWVSERMPAFLSETLFLTLSAQIAVLPLLIVYFKSISLISLLTNILILEVIPFTMLVGFIATLFALVVIDIGRILALLAVLPLRYMVWVIHTFAEVPFAAVDIGEIWVGWVVVYYVLLWRWIQ